MFSKQAIVLVIGFPVCCRLTSQVTSHHGNVSKCNGNVTLFPLANFLHFPQCTSFSPKILHRRCLQFLLGQLEIPKRNFTQWLLDPKFWGVSEMYYGQCENDGLSLSIKTDYEVKHFFGIKCRIFFSPATFFLSQGYLSSALAARTCKCICFEFEQTGCFYISAHGIRSIFLWDEMKIGLCKKDCRIKQHFTLESDNFNSRDREKPSNSM